MKQFKSYTEFCEFFWNLCHHNPPDRPDLEKLPEDVRNYIIGLELSRVFNHMNTCWAAWAPEGMEHQEASNKRALENFLFSEGDPCPTCRLYIPVDPKDPPQPTERKF